MAVSVISASSKANAEIGEIKLYPGATAPPRWLICNGAVIARATYSELFDVISTTYGGGNGSTTFAIPDLKGRTAIGVGENSATGHTAHTLGSSDGEEKHQLSTNELSAHSHRYTPNGVTFGALANANGGLGWNTAADQYGGGGNWAVSMGGGTQNTGSNWTHNTMQPFLTMNYIIYTGVE